MTPLEIIIRRVSIYMVISGTLMCIGCYIYKSRQYYHQSQNPDIPTIRIMMNGGHIDRELRIIRQIMNTNNQQIAPDIADDIADNLYNDIIIVVVRLVKIYNLGQNV